MSKLVGIGLLGLAAACGGGDDEKECIPGDASRIGYYCSDDGQWEMRQSKTTIISARDQSLCPDLDPGNYVLRRSFTGGSADCVSIPDEVVVINSDGSVSGIENPLVKKAADSCADQTTIDGCTSTLRRNCTITNCSFQMLITMDARTWTGAQTLVVTCPDGSGVSCSHDAWFESR